MGGMTQKIIQQLDALEMDPFEAAYHAGCTALQIQTIRLAAQGYTDEQIAQDRKVTRIAVMKTRTAACRRLAKYLEENTEWMVT